MDFSYMHFYKHMGGFFMHSISLPEKLTRQLVHLVGKVLELEGPSGSTWYVGLIRSGDKLVLQPGWNDFASDNNVSQNDHLVFKFIGESKFQVFIFDPTGCEKGGSFEKEEQERDGNLGLAVGKEWSKEVHKFGIKEKDKQHEFQGEIESSILNKKKPPTEQDQGGSEESNDSIPIEELRKILYQKGERQRVQGETKLQQPNIATKPPSKKLERNKEEDKETSKDSVNKVGVKDEPVLLPGFEIPPGFTAADKGRRFLPYLPIPTFNVNKVGVKDVPVLLSGFEIPPGFTAADKGRRFLPYLPPSQPSSIEATPKSRPKKSNKPPASKMPRRSSRLQKIREVTVWVRRSPRLQKIREAAIGPRRSMRLKEKRDR